MRTIEQVQTEIENIELNISELKADIDNFEYACNDEEFNMHLDECYEEVNICGMTYSASHALKELDLIAYRCAKSDYEANFDLEDCAEYTEKRDELEQLQCELEQLQDELNDLENEDE